MTTMLENPMVMGDYYADITDEPAYTCPKCRRDWYDLGDGWYESDMTIHHYPLHGHGCVGCLWDGRTQEDAYRFLLEQDERSMKMVLKQVVAELGAAWVLKLLHDSEADVVEQSAEAFADDDDSYLEWLINNKEA